MLTAPKEKPKRLSERPEWILYWEIFIHIAYKGIIWEAYATQDYVGDNWTDDGTDGQRTDDDNGTDEGPNGRTEDGDGDDGTDGRRTDDNDQTENGTGGRADKGRRRRRDVHKGTD